MHRDEPYFPGMQPLSHQLGCYMQHATSEYVFNGGIAPPSVKPLTPLHSVVIQPSDACPRNFVIFDQTTDRSQIMFHPEISSKFFHPGFFVDTTVFQDNTDHKDANDEAKTASSLKEDSDDIDVLLSIDDNETEEGDDEEEEEVSTARTYAMHKCNSPDSCSNYESLSAKRFWKSSGSRYNDKKHKRIQKMMKALRGIVPGARRMSTVAVLDEAVRHLKSLRMEVKKLGVRNAKG